jgi:hypothetical protein
MPRIGFNYFRRLRNNANAFQRLQRRWRLHDSTGTRSMCRHSSLPELLPRQESAKSVVRSIIRIHSARIRTIGIRGIRRKRPAVGIVTERTQRIQPSGLFTEFPRQLIGIVAKLSWSLVSVITEFPWALFSIVSVSVFAVVGIRFISIIGGDGIGIFWWNWWQRKHLLRIQRYVPLLRWFTHLGNCDPRRFYMRNYSPSGIHYHMDPRQLHIVYS